MSTASTQPVPSPLPPGDPERKGALIVFEGIDGSGKSTQARALVQDLLTRGILAEYSFEPTQGQHGGRLREMWALEKRHDAKEELELFRLDRMEHVTNLIEPGLRAGNVIVLDRYYYSSIAYQGSQSKLSPRKVEKAMREFAPQPDIAFFFELSIEKALERITHGRNDIPNILEKKENLEKVARVYKKMNSPEIVRIRAERDREELYREIWARTYPVLSQLGIIA